MRTSTSLVVFSPLALSPRVTQMENVFALVGLSFFTAAVSGATMGVYLAAVNKFIPVVSLRKALITNLVIALSLFFPIALQRELTGAANLGVVAWTAMGVMYLTFATAADVVNYIVSHRRT